MEIAFLDNDKKHNRISFFLKGATPGYANALRKTIIQQVPTMAIEDIELRKNSSALYDEMIALRLGLIPLKTDLKSYTLREKCKCKGEGCARCTVAITLSAKGPGTVYASELKSKDSSIKPVFPQMPIVKLLKNQELEFEATATLGTGATHAKWSPGLAWYSYKPTLTINNNSKKLEEFRDKYPQQIFDKEGKIDKNKIMDLNLVKAVDGVCDDVIKVEYDDTEFLFYLESWGQLSHKEIMSTALDILDEKLDEFDALIK